MACQLGPRLGGDGPTADEEGEKEQEFLFGVHGWTLSLYWWPSAPRRYTGGTPVRLRPERHQHVVHVPALERIEVAILRVDEKAEPNCLAKKLGKIHAITNKTCAPAGALENVLPRATRDAHLDGGCLIIATFHVDQLIYLQLKATAGWNRK